MDKNKIDGELNNGFGTEFQQNATAERGGSFSIEKFLNSLGKHPASERQYRKIDDDEDIINENDSEFEYDDITNVEPPFNNQETSEPQEEPKVEALFDDQETEIQEQEQEIQGANDGFEAQQESELQQAEQEQAETEVEEAQETESNDLNGVENEASVEEDEAGIEEDSAIKEDETGVEDEAGVEENNTDIENDEAVVEEDEAVVEEDEAGVEEDEEEPRIIELGHMGFDEGEVAYDNSQEEVIKRFAGKVWQIKRAPTEETNNADDESNVEDKNPEQGELNDELSDSDVDEFVKAALEEDDLEDIDNELKDLEGLENDELKDETNAAQEQTESSGEGGKQPKERRSIPKIDYFKYRFLSNSAVGADGKAKVEELATRFGHRREDNAGIITKENDESVTVHYNGEFKQNEIDLDFSKRGSAPVYKNSKVLSIACCVVAFIYAIIGVVLYAVFGTIDPNPVRILAVSSNLSSTQVFYQEVGTNFSLDGIEFTTYYSDGTQKTTPCTKNLIVNRSSNIDENLKVTSANTTTSSFLEFSIDGAQIYINIWGYTITAEDAQNFGKVYYVNSGPGIEYSKIICWYEFDKELLVGGKHITFKRFVDLNESNYEGSGDTLTSVTLSDFGNFLASNGKLEKVEVSATE